MTENINNLPKRTQFLLYSTEDGKIKIETRLQDENIWLTQIQMAELFQTTQQNISLHLLNTYESVELKENPTHKEFLSVRSKGKPSYSKLLGSDQIRHAVRGKSMSIPTAFDAAREKSEAVPRKSFAVNEFSSLLQIPHAVRAEYLEQSGAQQESPTQSLTQSTDPFGRLLFVLQQGELSSGELRSALKIKHRPTFRVNYLHPALVAGLIERTIPEKPNSRLQKYRLTEKGKKQIESIKL